ncbi:TetR/AcrR family transcriptional regulator [Streptomyces sp. NPDC003007]
MSEELTPHQRAAATKRKRTIRAVIEAAQVLFDTYGWHGVTVDDIAREAGVSAATINNHFATKRAVVVTAYAQPILSLMQATEKSVVNGAQVDWVIEEFIRELAHELHTHLTMAYALLPLARDQRSPTRAEGSEDVLDVSFWQLTELLGKLLERQECHDQSDTPAVEVADFYLSGLLTWIVQHPERSGEDAAKLTLSQLI